MNSEVIDLTEEIEVAEKHLEELENDELDMVSYNYADPGPSKRMKIEDPDTNSRLKYNLNAHCLVEIFKYLNSKDLWTLGSMNALYKQIINDLVIQKYKVKGSTYNDPSVNKIWRRHGKQIKRFQFAGGMSECNKFLQTFIRHCDEDQLKVAEFYINEPNAKKQKQIIDLSMNHLQKVESFSIRVLKLRPSSYITFPRFEALRVLSLYYISLPTNFDWLALVNLIELELVECLFKEQNFYYFIRKRPKLKRFVYMNRINDVKAIGKEMTKYSGDHMRSFHDFINTNAVALNRETDFREKYNFLAGFKHLKEVTVSPMLICPCDIVQALRLLAENDTLEKLSIILQKSYSGLCSCSLYQKENRIKMKQFTRLKTLLVHNRVIQFKNSSGDCVHSKLFTEFSSQLLSNVENVILSGFYYYDEYLFDDVQTTDIEFLRNALNLRTISIYNIYGSLTTSHTFHIFSIVKNILKKRLNKQNRHFSIDFIGMIVNEDQWKRFQLIGNVEKYIKFKIREMNATEIPISDREFDAGIKKNL